MAGLKTIARLALSDGIPARALFVAALVGSILNLINQGDVLWGGAKLHLFKLGLTYLTPYIVSTHGSVATRLKALREAKRA